MKKKMRVALGAALPALGMIAATMIAPAARAASAKAAAPQGLGGYTCSKNQKVHTGGNPTSTGTNPFLSLDVCFKGYLIYHQSTSLGKQQTGLTDRIRFRTTTGALKKQVFINPGTINDDGTLFQSSPYYSAASICTALVANSNHSDVIYGPLCITTSG